jgi:hypothetical protein
MMIERYYGISPDTVQQLIIATKNKVNDTCSRSNDAKSSSVPAINKHAVNRLHN